MDGFDRKILTALQRNGRASMAELGEAIGLSISACHRRVKLLEEAGLIEGYAARLNREALGLRMELFVTVSLTSQASTVLEAFEAAVRRVPEIVECHLLAGRADYLMRIAIADMSEYEALHRTRLTSLPGVSNMETTFNLRTVTPFAGYPVPEARG
ncbi:MAG: AsnC family transcriptional regulator [Rhizobiales bacterium PAR1]|nr:MAG: AsnC family transcriptional regulator [Rhizobiales bacterium PAR1]